jgi:hypothetical protein
MGATKPLKTNGLVMPGDFPTAEYGTIFDRVSRRTNASGHVYDQFASAWNAVSYRYLAMTEDEQAFTALVTQTAPEPQIRYEQERALFGFFSNGFSVVESTFYGLFALGAMLSPAHFPIASPKEQQRISPQSTMAAFKAAFTNDAINSLISALTASTNYIEWREIRNILTHRAAPGRTFFVGIGGAGDEPLPDQWKIKGIALDKKMAVSRRSQLADLLNQLLNGSQEFVERNF